LRRGIAGYSRYRDPGQKKNIALIRFCRLLPAAAHEKAADQGRLNF
jgi:hypothetical protein